MPPPHAWEDVGNVHKHELAADAAKHELVEEGKRERAASGDSQPQSAFGRLLRRVRRSRR